ncbi:transcriptional regulator [Pasteurellaceae bacterium RH1A]|nr:transcriptional regulator [Pasteurellaceae bacterium RH1A]
MIVTTPKMLAHAIREYRYQDNLSQTDIAKLAGTKQATVSVFENMPESTKLETLFKILMALELELVVQPRPKMNTAANQDELALIVAEPTTNHYQIDDEDW